MTVTSIIDATNSSLSNSNLSEDKNMFETIIIGAGFSGIGMAVNLKKYNLGDFIIFERNSEVGGTWHANNYPGCACDVPSNVYSFSFAPNPNWSRTFSPQKEIQQYLHDCATKFGIMDKIKLNTMVNDANWDVKKKRWIVQIDNGSIYYSKFLVAASGALSEPSIPVLSGLSDFKGRCFHSARWDYDVNLKDKKVAVIGTGASAIQFIPEIADSVDKLYVFMRTAPWILPRRDRKLIKVEQILFNKIPALQLLTRAAIFWARESYFLAFTKNRKIKIMKIAEAFAKRHLDNQVDSDEIKASLSPNYEMGCKRILLSNNFYPVFNKQSVKLVTSSIEAVAESSIVCSDKKSFDIDVIIFGTGFDVAEMPVAKYIRGQGNVTLSEMWRGSPRALFGTTVQNFPNLFLLMGPNTGLGHNSMVYMIESQINYIIQAMKELKKQHKECLVPQIGAVRSFTDTMDLKTSGTVWLSGCVSWYLDKKGRNPTLWPDFSWKFRSQTRNVDLEDYILD